MRNRRDRGSKALLCAKPAAWLRAGAPQETLDAYLKRWNIVAIEGIDTRALVRHIRDKGAMRACISTTDLDEASLVEKARQSPSMENRELASVVTTKQAL